MFLTKEKYFFKLWKGGCKQMWFHRVRSYWPQHSSSRTRSVPSKPQPCCLAAQGENEGKTKLFEPSTARWLCKYKHSIPAICWVWCKIKRCNINLNNQEAKVTSRYFREQVAKACWQSGLGWCVPHPLPGLQPGHASATCCQEPAGQPRPSKIYSAFLSQNLWKRLVPTLHSSFASSWQLKQDLCWFTLIPLAFQLAWLTGEKYFISKKWCSRKVDWLERDKVFLIYVEVTSILESLMAH